MTVTEALKKLLAHENLGADEAEAVLGQILAGGVSEVEIAGLLIALAMKGETVDELAGFARAMRRASVAIGAQPAAIAESGTGRDALATRLVDTCGTGGDAAGTFNISTATALVVAGAGVKVAKHGNRSISSRCGSADVFEALGVSLAIPPKELGRCLAETGLAFLFAPALHPAMAHVQPVRRALKVRTIFNLLGPLTNPAGAAAQVVGVYSAELTEKLGRTLAALGVERAFVVHGLDGLDEFTTTAPTRVAEVNHGQVLTYEFDALRHGIPRATLADLAGGDAAGNARLIASLLQGEKGPRRDIVVLNAAAALLLAGRARGWEEALAQAALSIDGGAAQMVLERLRAFRA